MRLHLPHPRRAAQQRRARRQAEAARVRRAVRNARLDTYCRQVEDRLDTYRQRQQNGRWPR